MPEFRKIFPSYDWDQDVAFVNQIINYPKIVGAQTAGFIKNVPNEEVKRDDVAIKRWIRENMKGCSCYVLFVGEKTYLSRWVLFEMDLARDLGLGRIIIYLDGMRDILGRTCGRGFDPYKFNNCYTVNPDPNAYLIKSYHWTHYTDPYSQLWGWIEDACRRAGR